MVPVGSFEHHFGPADVGDERTQRVLEDVLDPDRRGQMEDLIGLRNQPVDEGRVHDVALDETEARVLVEGGEILESAGGQVIQGPDLVAFVQECLAKM